MPTNCTALTVRLNEGLKKGEMNTVLRRLPSVTKSISIPDSCIRPSQLLQGRELAVPVDFHG